MSDLFTIASICWGTGLTILLGALLARFLPSGRKEIIQETIHITIAFGGGVLIAAVAFALVPMGLQALPLWLAILLFFAGSVLFMWVDVRLSCCGGSKAQFMAMLLDFLPEAISLGAVFPYNPRLGLLLALFIGAQNLPEGFNAYRELIAGDTSPRRVLAMMFALSFLGPLAGLLGYLFLQSAQGVVGALMLVAGGGIVYLVFQDIAPLVKMKRHWTPALGASLGFIVGMVGEKLLA
ncbi:divalent cation transporter [Candidatus Bipolaricaulota bacterium]|nr:divalent cation transporter [Candidatus Bipolaricaulota bacterium]TFH08784.1 MAG: divalent cation transporter [Candidatus Atribacteria bacterium]